MSKVVTINGDPVAKHGDQNEDLVQMLERALEAAKTGYYCAGAMSFCTIDDQHMNMWHHGGKSSFTLAGIDYLHDDFRRFGREEE